MLRRLALFLCLSACTQFPALDRAATPGIETAPFPALLPLDALLAGTEPVTSPEMVAGIGARAAALRGRAVRLQGPVIDRATRARMRRGVGPV
ncbi:hypothetical protein [Aestuariicoccus sp. MJ-SS9]|uniref:hypothetical protein n=1 Tax=Aestuariicoccus sp. MJ-SS9 TaxID=3079855 RepID=UPI002913DCA1|nr:hypothetical protein [Aestuariicoccus sp. MJ-SS9]MDU8912822.1 hypothetical protein [Aestuariicoccus sp. MJ-SS9]